MVSNLQYYDSYLKQHTQIQKQLYVGYTYIIYFINTLVVTRLTMISLANSHISFINKYLIKVSSNSSATLVLYSF